MASEAELRAALAAKPGDTRVAADLADLLTASGRAAEAESLLAPRTAPPDADIFVLTAHANALKAQERGQEALGLYERARAAAPRSAVAEHNIAGLLGDLHLFAESEAAAGRALAMGLDAPETWLVRARALQGLGRLDEAEGAYRGAVARRPAYADALGDLAQLIWMRTGDLAAAAAPLDAALKAAPAATPVRLKAAQLLEYAGDAAGAYRVLAAAPPATQGEPSLQLHAAQLASRFDPAAALAHAERADALMPGERIALITLAQAQLAAGQADAAQRTAEALTQQWPDDQHAIALLATAWRLAGDVRYRALYDYDAMVSAQALETPAGWSRLDDFLADLAQGLAERHFYRTHPLGQSLRGGSQTEQSLTLSDHPAIRAFITAIDAPIRRHIAGLGQGDDPLRRRIAVGGGYRIAAAWSVRLAPRGFHAGHVHQKGWLSSACHIVLPRAVERGHEGWLQFGEPGVATAPPLGPERFQRPEPGKLVLFPSYMWHGTQPFDGDEPRLSIAFDLLPA